MVRQAKRGAGCRCVCHERYGGSAHPKRRCACRGGDGYEPLSEYLALRGLRGRPISGSALADEIEGNRH